jgi:hypothetical protein
MSSNVVFFARNRSVPGCERRRGATSAAQREESFEFRLRTHSSGHAQPFAKGSFGC